MLSKRPDPIYAQRACEKDVTNKANRAHYAPYKERFRATFLLLVFDSTINSIPPDILL